MQPKLYVTNYPAGDFRAMPALGGGHALLKWVTSFPGNPAQGAADGDGARAALRRRDGRAGGGARRCRGDGAPHRGSRLCIAAETLCRPERESTAVVGCGVNGAETVRMFRALGVDVIVWDLDPARAAAVAERLGATVAASLAEALACDIVVTVTPGRELLFPEGSLRDGPARLDDGCGRAGQGRGRGRRSSRAPTLLRRLGAGVPRRGARGRGRGWAS